MNHNLNDLRTSIDTIDSAILLLLSERFRVTQKVGEYKRDNNLPSVDKTREEAQFSKLKQCVQGMDLDARFVEKMWRLIIDTVVENHKALKNSK
ncbi:MAG TPA: chorismate mutase [Candidatus Saccharimonadales bacterium]|nr:chorismate mutase [Candidatus Saccharimonadales bacterium]